MKIAITGSGSYLPETIVANTDFLSHHFLNPDGTSFEQPNEVIVDKFKAITNIEERRYVPPQYNNSDLGFFAAKKAITDANIDKETLDYIIFAHNFGEVTHGRVQSDLLPSVATRVKHKLQIKNPNCVAYDLIFGCPGWIEGVIQAYSFIKSGMAKTCLVIGGETLSRVVDKHDRDSMIFADGAGATIIQANDNHGQILAHASQTYANDEAYYLFSGETNNKEVEDNSLFIKMHGRKIYEFACIYVPKAMKVCLEKSGKRIDDVKKIFIHQANEKMDEAIINRFYKLYKKAVPQDVMPMMIKETGNSSVATIPTLFDRVKRGEYSQHLLNQGDLVLFASVGAGMNINCIAYEI